jgi:hypothetical protein
MSDSWQPILAVVAAILIAYLVILWLGAIVWVYRDSKERSRDPWTHFIAWLLVLVFNLPGLVLYLMIRPRETLIEAYERRLETEALMGDMPERRVCPSCQRTAKESYIVCPHCRTTLRQACGSCSKPLELTWVACPYCGAQGPQQISTPPLSTQASVAPLAAQPPTPIATERPSASRGRTTS